MANKKDNLGDRMKRYEGISQTCLTRRVPVIIRLDGKAFHTFTKGMKKPFEPILTHVMQLTMQHLCENIQGCVLGYTQSDEITLVLTDYDTLTTDAWFGYRVQKMCSVAASMATLAFNKFFYEEVSEAIENFDTDDDWNYLMDVMHPKVWTAMFDARVFSVPKEEVCNCLIWRQQDATRNSIEAVGQAHFSHKELHKKTCEYIQEMLFSQKGINWNDFPTEVKRGSCCVRKAEKTTMDDPQNPGKEIEVTRRKWVIDREIPIFTQNRAYIEDLL